MVLSYWVAKCLTDSDCYSVRARTRRECASQAAVAAEAWGARFMKPARVAVEYRSALDLLIACSDEDRFHWEG